MTNEEIVEEARQVKEQNWRDEVRAEAVSTKELIEKQVEQAADALMRADQQIGRMQERDTTTLEEKALAFMSETCERLLQIVQNQQSQIVHLNDRCDALRAGATVKDSDMCVCGHGTSDHGLRHGCLVDDCKCKQFRLGARR